MHASVPCCRGWSQRANVLALNHLLKLYQKQPMSISSSFASCQIVKRGRIPRFNRVICTHQISKQSARKQFPPYEDSSYQGLGHISVFLLLQAWWAGPCWLSPINSFNYSHPSTSPHSQVHDPVAVSAARRRHGKVNQSKSLIDSEQTNWLPDAWWISSDRSDYYWKQLTPNQRVIR